jgi:hypothetical protein
MATPGDAKAGEKKPVVDEPVELVRCLAVCLAVLATTVGWLKKTRPAGVPCLQSEEDLALKADLEAAVKQLAAADQSEQHLAAVTKILERYGIFCVCVCVCALVFFFPLPC